MRGSHFGFVDLYTSNTIAFADLVGFTRLYLEYDNYSYSGSPNTAESYVSFAEVQQQVASITAEGLWEVATASLPADKLHVKLNPDASSGTMTMTMRVLNIWLE